jgi:murein DD-endopeptidase MepM/ murein hydrolase activator NlpD
MPSSARSSRSKRRGLCAGAAAIGLLAILIVLGTPLAGRASAATIPMVFPLEKRVTVLHDYLAPRVGHLHQGTDLMAPKMTKELACVAGTVTLRVGTYGGVPEYSLWLVGDDGHGYFYIHINNDTPGTDDGKGGLANAFAPGLVSGAHVAQGQHIAYVGDSGNAESTGSHLHFEIHQTTLMSSASMDPYDSLVNAPLYNGTPPPNPGITRYEQTNGNLLYLGKWVSFGASGASGGTYTYADSPAKALLWFSGTKLDLIATTGLTQGKAQVSLDGVAKGSIDFSSSTTLRQQKVWTTGTLPSGTHKVELSWTGVAGASGGTRVNIDAVDVTGTLVKAAQGLVRYEQTDAHFVYAGIWETFSTTGPSGGTYKRTKTNGSSVTVNFTGTYLSWVATAGTTLSKAYVSLDGGKEQSIDLARLAVAYQQSVWTTGTLNWGPHTVKIRWDPLNTPGKFISVDAFDLIGTPN